MTVEQIVGFATLTAMLIGMLDWVIRLWFRRKGGANSSTPLLKKIDQLHEQLQQAKEETHQANDERNAALLKAEQSAGERLAALMERDHAREERDEVRIELGKAQDELAQARIDQERLQKQSRSLDRRVHAALKMGGQLWLQPPMSGTPPFRPLQERKTPIISVLNLKGGVGKTTLTAYLALGLAKRNYRVLLVDLDLQGSLSGMFVDEEFLTNRDKTEENLRHYLEAAARKPRTKLLDYACRLPFATKSAIVGTTDKHAYSEMNLTFQWLLRTGHPGHQWDGRRDARFLLRRGLHARSLSRRYDVVLLDCPPLINLSCVNALAASDYVLIPATCGRKSTERVPPLIRRVKELHDAINPQLKILGLVANRTRSGEKLNSIEQTIWNKLERHAKDELGVEVYTFRQSVPDRAEVRDAEGTLWNPIEGGDLDQAITKLTEEFEGRLPSECRRIAKVPAQFE